MTEEEKREHYSIYAFERPEDLYKICLLGYYTMQEGPRLFQRKVPPLMCYVKEMQSRHFAESQVKILYEWYHDKWCSEGVIEDPEIKMINENKLLIFSYGYMTGIDWGVDQGIERNIRPLPFKQMVEILLKEFDDQIILAADNYSITDFYEIYTD